MSEFIWFLLTLAAAALGGALFIKLKIPAGAMMGAILFVGLLNILTGRMYMPTEIKTAAKAVTGLFIGMSMSLETVINLKKLLKPAVILVVLIITLCFSMGVVLYYATDMDVVTSLFCVAPGGMSDMTLISYDMGGDSAVVAVIQVMRLLTVYCVSMPLVKVFSRRSGGGETHENTAPRSGRSSLAPDEKRKRILLSSLVTVVGGVIGEILGIAVDFSVLVMVVTMIIAAAVNIKTGKLYMPKKVRQIAQILSGALVGTNMTQESLVSLKSALLPALIVCCGFLCVNIILAFIFNKVCKIDMATSMLSTSAGGASEAALVAGDFGADPAVVSVMQITRLASTTAFYPIVVKLIYQFL